MHAPGIAYRNKHKREVARGLRRNPTDAERRLWSRLRRKQLGGIKFRRQQPMGAYVADFYCPAAKLIIELDGMQHGDPARYAYDVSRTRFLERQGYTVLRFTNHEAMRDTERVIGVIWHAIEEKILSPPRSACRASTLPQGEGQR